MAARVLCVDELATLIATHLVAINPRSATALAQTCRALEVPALSALWETQVRIKPLVVCVLPEDAWSSTTDHQGQPLISLNRPLTTSELDKMKRYASWMRRLVVWKWFFSEDITRLFVPTSSDSQPSVHFTLRELTWWLSEDNYTFVTTFLSPHLIKISIRTDPTFYLPAGSVNQSTEKVLTEAVPVMRSVIKAFPSSLQFLTIELCADLAEEIGPIEEISTFISGRGQSLRNLHSNLVFSTEAVIYLMNLPNLRGWMTGQKPPQVTGLTHNGASGDPTCCFPSLKSLYLSGEATLEWFSLFETAKDRFNPWTVVGNNLSLLHDDFTPNIDSTSLFRYLPFINLADIALGAECTEAGYCVSLFSDQDVECLATTLPKLEVVNLGSSPCGANTCSTTILSLLLLSVHCTNLKQLRIHFRTTNTAADVLAMVGYAYSHDLHRKPRCAITTFYTGSLKFSSEDYEFALLSIAIYTIFPSLTLFLGQSDWARLEDMMVACRRVQETTDVMEFLNELRMSESSEEHKGSFSLRERVERFLQEKVTPATQGVVG